MFEGMDVVINGHIHRSSVLKSVEGETTFIYSGSMECRDFSEKEHNKCFLVYDSTKKGLDSILFKRIPTRKFVDFEIDYSSNPPEKPTEEILEKIESSNIDDAVVRLSVRIPETKIALVDTAAIRTKFHQSNVSCISDVTVSPVISKQLRNQKVNEAPDDISAFKHYVSSQTNVDDNVLTLGLAILTAELEG